MIMKGGHAATFFCGFRCSAVPAIRCPRYPRPLPVGHVGVDDELHETDYVL
jgi:hypothetical protein